MTNPRGQEGRSDELAVAREQFLREESVAPDAVRRTILASWWRSRTWKVAADSIELSYVEDPDVDTPLARCARPILERLQEQLNDSPVSAVLTDEKGVVLDRRTEDRELERYLDRVHLAPGFSYAEEFVGTNGIGTALEGLQPTAVFGHEHYAEDLDTLACAGAPIRHPVSGQVVGLLDFTCWRRDANPLLMTLAKATAHDIHKEFTAQVGVRELTLFAEYLRACRRGQGIVFAVNSDLVMTNEHALQTLEPQDQAAMLTRMAEVIAEHRESTLTVDLPSGTRARMSCTPVSSGAGPAGGVVRARLIREAVPPSAVVPAQTQRLPGVVGSGALWTRACQEVAKHHRAREWLVVEGETGAGKLALLQGVHGSSSPAAPLAVIDFADRGQREAPLPQLRQALARETGTVVLRHLDELSPVDMPDVAEALAVAGRSETRGPWVAATVRETGNGELSDDILCRFPCSVAIPPLRHHIEDIRELVPFLLVKQSQGAQLTCAPATLQPLLRGNWPGNIAQLQRVLRKVVAYRRSGTILPEDLPPECQAVTRRVLTPIESMERDAIVRSLLDCEGNKARAAHALGMSRATIYRKIRDYGIDVPGQPPHVSK